MHDKELDNCRLVSMMGVKPNIVLETMRRYNTTPDHVFLCSDNDTAGNEFADRLMQEYPEMQRIITPDRYKDWNDMLRGIPKKEIEINVEQTKEADKMPERYGNEYWNKATDNRNKSIVSVSAHDFPRVQEQIENAGMNYYAYPRGESVIMAINDADVEKFGRLTGASNIVPQKSQVTYVPPEKNIIGKAEYRYIPQKEYISADRDLILKMADKMEKQGIQFSGRVYPSGKGTLTVSHADLFAVRNIRDEVVNMRKQFASLEQAEEVGTRSYRANRDSYYYMSKLTPEQFKEVKPFLETGVGYHAVSRDGKVAFALDKNDAPNFHRALQSAEREVNLVHNMQDMGLSMEQMVALSPVLHRVAVDDIQLNIADFFDNFYDDAQFGEMLSLVNAYISQSPAERFGEHSKLNDMLEAKSSFDRSIELSDFFSQHDFSDEQRAAVTAMFVGDVTRGQLDSIDETFTVEDIQQYSDILRNALSNSEIAEYLEQHRQTVIDRENAAKEPTEEEVLFGCADLAKFIAEGTLSSDEWEDLSYPLFEDGYADKHKPSEKALFGYGLPETELYALADKMHSGEDIRAELAHKLMGKRSQEDIEFVFEGGEISDRTYYYSEGMRHNLHAEYGENSVVFSFAGMEREVSYDEIGQAFLDRIEEEHKEIQYFRTIEELSDAFPGLSVPDNPEHTAYSDLIRAFEGAAMPDWERGDNQPKINRIKKALYDILGSEEQTQCEKFMHDWSLHTPEQQYQQLLDRANTDTMLNISNDVLPMEQKIEKYIPFVFFGEGERPKPVTQEQTHGTFEIYQMKSGEQYHFNRFESLDRNKDADLTMADYDLIYSGDLAAFPAESTLEAIYTKFNVDHPEDFRGHSLSMSDVIVTEVDGEKKAFYCDDIGFTEFPDFFRYRCTI